MIHVIRDGKGLDDRSSPQVPNTVLPLVRVDQYVLAHTNQRRICACKVVQNRWARHVDTSIVQVEQFVLEFRSEPFRTEPFLDLFQVVGRGSGAFSNASEASDPR